MNVIGNYLNKTNKAVKQSDLPLPSRCDGSTAGLLIQELQLAAVTLPIANNKVSSAVASATPSPPR